MFLCCFKTIYIERSWDFKSVDVCVWVFHLCL